MTVNKTFSRWTVISDEPPDLIIEHDETGKRFRFKKDGTFDGPSVTTEVLDTTEPAVRAWYDGNTFDSFKISDYSDIGAAMDAASQAMPIDAYQQGETAKATGGTIELPGGVWVLSTKPVIDRWIRLKGQGPDKGGTSLFADATLTGHMVDWGASASGDPYSIPEIRDIFFNGAGNASHGVYQTDDSDAVDPRIINCWFDNFTTSATRFARTYNVVVERCTFEHNAAAITFGLTAGGDYVNAARVVDNHFMNQDDGATDILINAGDEIKIHDNDFIADNSSTSTSTRAVDILTDRLIENVSIKDNDFTGYPGDAIRARTDVADTVDRIRNVSVNDNSFISIDNYCLLVDAEEAHIRNVGFKDNVIRTAGGAVHVIGDGTYFVDRLDVSDNVGQALTDFVTRTSTLPPDLRQPKVHANNVEGAGGGTAISLHSGGGSAPQNPSVQDNLIYDFTTGIQCTVLALGPGVVKDNVINEVTTEYDLDTGIILNGVVAESANAETPQGTYPTGTKVDFTDSGDGTGTGWYIIDRSGTPNAIA